MNRLSRIPIHPLLFASYPVLALYAVNVHEVTSAVIWRPLFISLAGALLLLAILFGVLRNLPRAALIASIGLLLFFTYGRLYDALKNTPLVDLNVVRHRYLLILFIALLLAGIWLSLRRLKIRGRPPPFST